MEAAVAERLLVLCGHTPGYIYGRRGCAYIKKNVAAFHHLATEASGVLVLTDFRDSGAECIVSAMQDYIWNHLPQPPASFLCRFAIPELESWLMADREGMANFLHVSLARMPDWPEGEELPKRVLVNIARKSRKTFIREGIAPPPGHQASVGPKYGVLLREFISGHWNIAAAAGYSPSLERYLRRLRELTQG